MNEFEALPALELGNNPEPFDPDWWRQQPNMSVIQRQTIRATQALVTAHAQTVEIPFNVERARDACYVDSGDLSRFIAFWVAVHGHRAIDEQAGTRKQKPEELSHEESVQRMAAVWSDEQFIQDALARTLRDYVEQFAQAIVAWEASGNDEAFPASPYLRLLDEYRKQVEARRPVPRKSNRKITIPSFPNGLLPVPNILNHGTRHLGQMIAGDAEWTSDPDRGAMIATINGRAVGMIEFGIGGEDEAGHIIDALEPRCLKGMIAMSATIWQKARGSLVNQVVPLGAGEVARAMGYKPNRNRTIDSDILLRVASDLRNLTRILTYAADAPWDKRAKSANSGWIAPLLVIPAVHVEQIGLDGTTVPIEFDAMLGRNWAEAMQERYNVLQVTPGFMDLDPHREGQAINLAWFYLTDFRYRMKRGPRKYPMRIPDLCRAARIDPGAAKDRGRFLDRLDKWHARLQELGIIGCYERDPKPGTNWPPSKVFAEGAYRVGEPAAILDAYKKPAS